MSREDWYRNTTWDADIEAAFNARLDRSRKPASKAQHLRIQAGCLASRRPEVAHALLDRYFAVGERFEDAMAHATRAEAYLAQTRVDDAVSAFEAALAREVEFPNLRTRTFLDLPKLIAERRLVAHYPRALSLLKANASHLTFHADRYVWNGCLALILAHQGQRGQARPFAKAALEAAAATHSGFRYHPTVGLVEAGDAFFRRVTAISRWWSPWSR